MNTFRQKSFLLDLKSVEIVLIWSVVPCIIISYALDESPRWLLSKGQEIPAKKIIQTMIKMNGQPLENLSKVQKQQKTAFLKILPRIVLIAILALISKQD